MTSKEYLEKLGEYRIDPSDTSHERLGTHLRLLERLDRIERSSVALFDMSTFQYRFLTDRFKFLLGYEAREARETGVTYFFDFMNQDDLSTFFDTSIRSMQFLYSIPPGKRRLYKTCQDFRIRRRDNTWIRMLQQILVLEQDMHGDIWLVLTVNDVSPLKDLNVPARRYMEDIKTGERVLFPARDSETSSPLTPRQLEVLGLIARGYHSRNIADYLGISVSTVNNHRQQILAKTNSANTAEAVGYAMSLGLITG